MLRFITHFLRTIFLRICHVFLATPSNAPASIVFIPAATNLEELNEPCSSWYISSWGLISPDGCIAYSPLISRHNELCSESLFNLREPDTKVSDEPVYYAPTFQEAVAYLPLSTGFESVFSQNKHIYYVVDRDPKIYHTSAE
ncbi:hypothetical protein K438DRAFT_1983163 [Mycena galopus ATCC 62051]|nr:hypothetical protein K438DRAFT_1983163 [Mycena galopus ATCC 62051]